MSLLNAYELVSAQEQQFVESLQEKYKLRNPMTLGTDLAGDHVSLRMRRAKLLSRR